MRTRSRVLIGVIAALSAIAAVTTGCSGGSSSGHSPTALGVSIAAPPALAQAQAAQVAVAVWKQVLDARRTVNLDALERVEGGAQWEIDRNRLCRPPLCEPIFPPGAADARAEAFVPVAKHWPRWFMADIAYRDGCNDPSGCGSLVVLQQDASALPWTLRVEADSPSFYELGRFRADVPIDSPIPASHVLQEYGDYISILKASGGPPKRTHIVIGAAFVEWTSPFGISPSRDSVRGSHATVAYRVDPKGIYEVPAGNSVLVCGTVRYQAHEIALPGRLIYQGAAPFLDPPFAPDWYGPMGKWWGTTLRPGLYRTIDSSGAHAICARVIRLDPPKIDFIGGDWGPTAAAGDRVRDWDGSTNA